MIESEFNARDRALAVSRVRQNVASAAIAAALMLWFGVGVLRFSGASGTFGLGDMISIRTLRFGGIAMAVSALASITGSRWALLFDGVCSLLIGGLLCLSAALMMTGGGPGVLYIIVGVMFALAGVRNVREWAALSPGDSAKPPRVPESPDPRTISPRDVMATGSLAGRLCEKKRTPDPAVKPPPSPPPEQRSETIEADPPPDGFLASFAPEPEDTSDNA